MAHAPQQFALVGYSEDLERRSLKFVEPIPAARICTACGNIPRSTYTLMCGHTFCYPCYKSCATISGCVCPLDGDVCDRDDVTKKEYKAEQLLSRKVHCWNEANGCCVILPASQIANHVRHDCQHHVTRCSTCSAVVLCRDVCAHLKSRCTTLVLHTVPEAQHGANDNERTHLVAFERKVEKRVGELYSKLAQLTLESSSQSDKLVELCHNINHLNETLKERIGPAADKTLDHLHRNRGEMKALTANGKTIEERVGKLDSAVAQLSLNCGSMNDKLVEVFRNNNHLKEALTKQFDRKVAELKDLYAEKIESLKTALASELASVPSDLKNGDQRVVAGYAALKKKAAKDGLSQSWSDDVYLRRYLMSWGIEFKKKGESVGIVLCLQLKEGREDEFCARPFTKELKLSIIHPETRKERVLRTKPSTEEYARGFYWRPINGRNAAVCFLPTWVESNVMERGGYVKEDRLLLRFEVLE